MGKPFELPELKYAYAALEPIIDARTMEIHHTKHHAAYVNNLNKALESAPEWFDHPIEEILRRINEIPESIRTAVRNHGGGHANHSLFWEVMTRAGPRNAWRLGGGNQHLVRLFCGFSRTVQQCRHHPLRLRLGLAGGRWG